MSVFFWSPEGNSCDLREPQKKWANLAVDQDLTTGTWYYGPLDEMPVAAIPTDGWVVDCHNVWDHPKTRKTIVAATCPMCIISYVSFNGKLAQTALKIAQETFTPIIIVYKHSHKAAVMIHLREEGHNPIGLIDDRWVNLQPVLSARFLGIHCLTAVDPDIKNEERMLSYKSSSVIVVQTQKKLSATLLGGN